MYAEFLVRCILEGLKYLHGQQILHRDLKPENVVVDQRGYCKITDLGLASTWKQKNYFETSGTPGYMAPEILLVQNHSYTADYYSLGILAFELVTGKRPFRGNTKKMLRNEVQAKDPQVPESSWLSTEGRDFINRLIERSAQKRLGCNGIEEIFSHPWLQMDKEEYAKFQRG